MGTALQIYNPVMGLGLGIHVRLVRAWRGATRRWRQRPRRPAIRHAVEKLHVGSGPLVREGWTNVDIEYHPGVEFVLDVREGLPFRDVRYIYAEHFLEHLDFDEGLRFLRECREALRPDGVLRLSTPNLDWVWRTQYRPDGSVAECFALNKAFRGWGHQFLYNFDTLEATLRAAGFGEVDRCRYGESRDPVLRQLERHERYPDEEILPHVVIVEARGMATADSSAIEEAHDDYDWARHP